MSGRDKPAMPPGTLAAYRVAVAATKGAELKGATMPYTSVKGNMYSFLDKQGVMAVRLGKADYDLLLSVAGSHAYVHETGTALKEYVAVPPAVLIDTKAAADWLGKSLAHARTLKPKPTRKNAA